VKRLARTWQMLVGISELVSYGFTSSICIWAM
jgi:hypothetical protein